jgi:hypothetical protein
VITQSAVGKTGADHGNVVVSHFLEVVGDVDEIVDCLVVLGNERPPRPLVFVVQHHLEGLLPLLEQLVPFLN